VIPLRLATTRIVTLQQAEEWRAKAELLATGADPETLQKVAAIAEDLVRKATNMAVSCPIPGCGPAYFMDMMMDTMQRLRPTPQSTAEELTRIYDQLTEVAAGPTETVTVEGPVICKLCGATDMPNMAVHRDPAGRPDGFKCWPNCSANMPETAPK
jgi:hypothetical protein